MNPYPDAGWAPDGQHHDMSAGFESPGFGRHLCQVRAPRLSSHPGRAPAAHAHGPLPSLQVDDYLQTPGRPGGAGQMQPGGMAAPSLGLSLQTPQRPTHGMPGGGATMATPGSAISPGSAMPRPQLHWRHEIDNSDQPFVPKLRGKPNAVAPLELRLEHGAEEPVGLEMTPGGSTPRRPPPSWYANPYTPELNAFQPTDAQLLPGGHEQRAHAPPLHATPCMWVATGAALHALAEKLRTVDEVGLAVASHDYRSYRGFVALLAISTADEDYLVDGLELRGQLGCLNEVLTNPRITKVMHGADREVAWLQRDFGLYLVGLFDTGQAARVLEFPSYALAPLLKQARINTPLPSWWCPPPPPHPLIGVHPLP